ncbi:MAG: hydrogenase expression/formation protein HypE [Desulfovibrio sp.]|mgnify:CR=1 FL=1|nr:MAG: hydrogenase expression/formation protein HypE [Desulfovibrio sp.]
MAGETLLLDYGSGGRASQRLVSELFVSRFKNPVLDELNDAARLDISGPVAMSTDSFTVDPIFFPGGDIGSLAVHGTVNDVAMLGARPKYLSCGFLLEEGLDMDILTRIVDSMAGAAEHAGVIIATGDTKVVPRGALDKIFINTTGIGEIFVDPCPAGQLAAPGDAVIISGTMGDHGLTILAQREGLTFDAPLESDCASLNHLIERLILEVGDIHVLRDPTRGGLATTLNEIAGQSATAMIVEEDSIPVNPAVSSGCSFLGLDPLYLANEGKLICVLPQAKADKALELLHSDPLGKNARIIGQVEAGDGQGPARAGQVVLKTRLGGHRLLSMLEGEQLPRIC